MPDYEASKFEPPAPVANVTLRNRETGATRINVPMLLDTGADVTLLPQAATDQIGVIPVSNKSYELVGFDGSASLAQIVQLDLIFMGRTFRGQFLLIDQEWGIMGRNILNAVPLLFNGPNLAWDEFKVG